jgi:1-acyl-sn-glycerol-3-phosphate acyltransferase
MGTTVLLGMACSIIATLILTPIFTDLVLFKNPPRGAPRWWHLLGTVWVTIHLGASELILWYVLRPVLKIVSPGRADSLLRRATSRAAFWVVKALPFGKLEFRDLTPATLARPSIVISNHQSAVDVMLMVALPGDVRQTAKKRVFDAPMLGVGCKLCGHIMVEPNDPETTLQRCKEKLAEGASVHFFPEGTRSLDGALLRFHRGAFELAAELGTDILPIVLCDTWTAMPRDGYWFEPYHVIVQALPRITPQNFDYSRGSLALMRHSETLVRDALYRLLQEVNTPKVLRRKVQRLYRYQSMFVEQFVYWKMKLDPMFPWLNQVVPREASVLDLGCGFGIATHWLAYGSYERTLVGLDYDEHKVRVAQRSAPENPRIRFETADILVADYPACDVVLLLDVLHYWVAEKQQLILDKAARALRPGGCLVLREAARDETSKHGHVEKWERFALFSGQTKRGEGLHFQTLDELLAALKQAGFVRWEIKREAGRGSNVLLVAWTGPKDSSGAY